MSADIVERLRELGEQADAFSKNQHHSFVTTQQMARESAEACREAAAEIERLRKINSDHCRAVNSYILDNSRQEDARKTSEARADAAEAEIAAVRRLLTGGDIGSLPHDWSISDIAEARVNDMFDLRCQVRDTCRRAEAAEAELAKAREALEWYELAGEKS